MNWRRSHADSPSSSPRRASLVSYFTTSSICITLVHAIFTNLLNNQENNYMIVEGVLIEAHIILHLLQRFN